MTEEAQCGFEVRQAEMPCGRTREALKGGTVEPPRFAVVPLHRPGWIAVHFYGFPFWGRWVRMLGELSKRTTTATPEEAPVVWVKFVCLQTSPSAASLTEDLRSRRVCMKLSWKGGKPLLETGAWQNPSSC